MGIVFIEEAPAIGWYGRKDQKWVFTYPAVYVQAKYEELRFKANEATSVVNEALRHMDRIRNSIAYMEAAIREHNELVHAHPAIMSKYKVVVPEYIGTGKPIPWVAKKRSYAEGVIVDEMDVLNHLFASMR